MRKRLPVLARLILAVTLPLATCPSCAAPPAEPEIAGAAAPRPAPGGAALSRIDGWIDENRRAMERGALVVANRDMTDAELRALLGDRRMTQLGELTLHDNALTAEGVRTIATSPLTSALSVLQLTHNHLGDEGLAALAGWGGSASLRSLFLGGNGASAAGARALADSPHLGPLEILELGHQPLGDAATGALVRFRAGKLHLERSGLTGAGARRLIADAAAPRLFLAHNPVGPGGLQGLQRISPTLSTLSLPSCDLGPADARALAAVDAPSLKLLVLARNPLGSEGLDALANAPWLGRLAALDVMASGADADARARLRAAWGDRAGLVLER